MDSDDPEARIRDLERRLADQANASELSSPGQQFYPPPPPNSSPPPPMPPQLGYGSPYTMPYPPPMKRRSPGLRAGRFIWLGVLAVVAVSIITSISSFNSMFRDVRAVFDSPTQRPTVSFDPANPGSQVPAVPVEVPAGGQLSVSGVAETKTINCNDGAVNVSGVQNNLQITGHCVDVTVSGMSNTVTVESADTITASGLENRITFKTGQPVVNNSGVSNVVEPG